MVKTKVLVLAAALTCGASAHAQFLEIFKALNAVGGAPGNSAQPANPLAAMAGATAPAQGQAGGADLSKIGSKPMTAKEIFAAKGALSSLNLMQKLGASGSGGLNAQTANSLLSGNFMGVGTDIALKMAVQQVSSYLSFAALDHVMGSLAERPDLMSKITVDVPQVMALGQPQLQEDVLNVAQYLAAMKASNALVEESEKSLEKAKERYKNLMVELDQKSESLGAASMLVGEAFQMNEAKLKVTKGQDLEYVRTLYGKGFKEVLQDPLARQIVETELRAQTPGEFKSIDLAEQEVATHYQSYAKTVSGSLTMLGFGAMFLTNVKAMTSKSQAHGVIVVPMAFDGAKEVASTIKNTVSALTRNDDLVEGTFALTVNGKTSTGVSASNLLGKLTEDQQKLFAQSLIGKSPQVPVSYLAQLNRRSSAYSADILDRIVDSSTRDGVAKTVYNLEDTSKFNFKLAFDDKQKALPLKASDNRIKSRIYEDDFSSVQEDETEKLYAQIQDKVRGDFKKLTNQDLRRIMFLINKGESMQIGDAYVRMEQPGLQGLADRREMLVAVAGSQAAADSGKKPNPGKTPPASSRKTSSKKT